MLIAGRLALIPVADTWGRENDRPLPQRSKNRSGEKEEEKDEENMKKRRKKKEESAERSFSTLRRFKSLMRS